MVPILVHRPVYPAGLRLLRHHQGDRPQESHRPDQTARKHRGDPRKHRHQRKLTCATDPEVQAVLNSWSLAPDSFVLPSCRSTLLQRTGCTKRPGICFWRPKWWIVPHWSWSGASRTRRRWSSSCVARNSSGQQALFSPVPPTHHAGFIFFACLLSFLAMIIWSDQLFIQHLTTRPHSWPCRGSVYGSSITWALSLFTYNIRFIAQTSPCWTLYSEPWQLFYYSPSSKCCLGCLFLLLRKKMMERSAGNNIVHKITCSFVFISRLICVCVCAARTGCATAVRRLWRADRAAHRDDWTPSSPSLDLCPPNGRYI